MEEARWTEKETKGNPGQRAIQCELVVRNGRHNLSPGTLRVSPLTMPLIEKFKYIYVVLQQKHRRIYHAQNMAFFIHDARSTSAGILLHLST